MRAKLVLLAALAAAPATAIEPWQQVLILDTTEIGELLKECEFKATVSASGPVDKLAQRIAQQALDAGGNTVHVLGAANAGGAFAVQVRATVNGRAFLCARKGVAQ